MGPSARRCRTSSHGRWRGGLQGTAPHPLPLPACVEREGPAGRKDDGGGVMSPAQSLRLWRIAAPFVVGIALLALWEVTVAVNGIPPYILPGPVLIAESL